MAQAAEANWGPQKVVMAEGTPKREIHCCCRAEMQKRLTYLEVMGSIDSLL
jgi:hypothetical protein